MILIDTHSHVYGEQFDQDRKETMQRALNVGVKEFYLPAIDSEYQERMNALQAAFPEQVFLMTGLHPTHVHPDNVEAELAHVEKQLAKKNIVAVGEIGIDLYWDKTHQTLQTEAFAQQIEWALVQDLPIVIHGRDSFDEIFEVLEKYKSPKLRGIFHCFTGTLEHAQTAIDLGLKLGIGGVVTFKNGKIDQFLNQIPLENLVLETDAPYLAPVPYRGKRNEPSYVKLVAEKLAEIYGITLAEIAQQTTQNAREIFKT